MTTESPPASSGHGQRSSFGWSARAGGVLAGVIVTVVIAGAVLPHGLPAGTIALGLVFGSFNALTAAGLVLIYRGTRIISFAQANIGGLGAALAVIMVSGWHISYYVAVPSAILVAAASGALIDRVVVRRFRTAPRLLLTVATIGVGQILAAAQVFLPHLAANIKITTRFVTPFSHLHFRLGRTALTGDDVVAVAAALVVLGGLGWFLDHTVIGASIRACADSEERAVLLGIPVRMLSTVTWSVAAVLSVVGALAAQPIVNTNVVAAVQPSALAIPLAAAIIARLESIPIAVFASLGIGVLDQTVLQTFPVGGQPKADLAIFAVVLIALAVLPRRSGRQVDLAAVGGWIRNPRPVPDVLRRLPEFRLAQLGRLLLLGAVFGLLVPLTFDRTQMFEVDTAVVFGIIAVSLVPLSGWAGQISLGQFALAAGGACAAGSLMAHHNADLFASLGVAVVVGAVLATVIGLPALRIPGILLAAGTMTFAIPVSSYLTNSLYFPSLAPATVDRPLVLGRISIESPWVFYGFCLFFLALTLHLTANLRGSRAGRAIMAVRDNEAAAACFSINPVRSKLVAFAYSGALAGLAGGLYVLLQGGIPFAGFDPSLGVDIFVMVVVGGLGSTTGALLGVAYVESVAYLLTGAAQLLATGGGLLLLLMVAPGGLAELLYRARDNGLARMARRHGLEAAGLWRAGDRTDEAAVEDVGPELVAPGPRAHHDDAELLALRDIDAGYGSLQVLFGADLGVVPGEILALLGTNGAGKSTVLKVIGGLLPAQRGQLWFDGRDLSTASPLERVKAGVVVVPGGRENFGSLTVGECLSVAGWRARRSGKDVDALVAEALDLFPHLRARWDFTAASLSGGERQMLTIAQALLCEPQVLLIDELSIGLSPIVVGELLERLRRLRRSGTTIVVVEQSVNVAASLADRALFMERGQVRFAGPIADLVGRDDLLRSVFLSNAGEPAGEDEDAPVARVRLRERPAADAGVPSDAPIFSVSNLAKRFGGIAGVQDVSLSVGQGQIVSIIGSNGAGKTTLLDACSGFLVPDRGSVVFRGQDITGLSPSTRAALGLGRVFQGAELFPSMTVRDVVATSLERHVDVRDPLLCIAGTAAARASERAVGERVDELLETMRLSGHRESFISELSTGTRRVVELACAVAHDPSLLLLDEPSSGVAQREVEALGARLLDLQKATGMSMVVVEHDMPLVRAISDRAICMHMGAVLCEGSPDDVLADPLVLSSYLGDDVAARERSGELSISSGHPVGTLVTRDGWLTVREFAGRAGLSDSTVRRLVREGRIQAERIAGRYQIRHPQVALIEALTPSSQGERRGPGAGVAATHEPAQGGWS